MKPHAILSCFFSAYGVYLIVSSLFAAVISMSGLIFASSFSHVDGLGWIVAQYLVSFIPLFIGVALVSASRRLGDLTARYAGLSPELEWEIALTAQELLAALLATLGIYLAATEGSAILRILFLLFEVQAGGRMVSEAAASRSPDSTQIISHGLCAIAGIIIAKKCSRIAGMLIQEKKRPNQTPEPTPPSGVAHL